jgi:hypothetical protein
MHRPSIDLRRFARSNNRRDPALVERRSFFATPVEAATIGRIDETQSAVSMLSACCAKGHSPTSPRWSLRHAGRFSPTVTRRRDQTC